MLEAGDMMKWRNIKDKIIALFYKEIEIEEEEPEVKDANGSFYGIEHYRTPSMEEKSSEVKVRYQYPRKDGSPFRFPVIPDETRTSQGKSKGIAEKQRTAIKPLTGLSRQQQTVVREMDAVPAFMRRDGHQENKEPLSQQVDEAPKKKEEIEKVEEKSKPTEILPHSKPDELDAIFRKKDGRWRYIEEEPVKTSLVNETQESESIELINNSQPEERLTVADHSKNTEEPPDQNRSVLKEPAPAFIKEKEERPKPIIEEKKPVYEAVHQKDTEQLEKEETPEEPDVPDYLLNDQGNESMIDEDWLIEQQILLEDTFTHFNIDATVVNVTQGPSVTRFEIQPAMGVKVSKIKNLSDDLKLNLAAKDIRIEAPIPGRNTIGIEIPNKNMHLVNLQELFEADTFKEPASPLTIALGLTIEGEPVITNIDKMPHGLIAGATGSGKSVCINTIILSLLYKAHHNDVKLLLVDPKMVELTPYNNIPHLIAPVITNVKAATKALKWAVDEMEDRYQKFVELGVRNIQKYNEKVMSGQAMGEKLPYIVIIIDELADLMMVSPQEVEDAISRIAQKARACGMHLLLATQRPSVDVITGLIKANIPTRIAFSVSSQVDSRTMIDSGGAEKLLGKGDMLFVENGAGKAVRLQGPFVSDEEIERVAAYVRSIAEPNYLFEEEQLLTYFEEEEEDNLMGDVIKFVVTNEQASTSLLQRQFRIGYNRAARLIDNLEAKGIISGQNGSKPREVLRSEEQIEYQ